MNNVVRQLDAIRGNMLGTAEDLVEGRCTSNEAAVRLCADATIYLGHVPPAPELASLLEPFSRALFYPPSETPDLEQAARGLLASSIDIWPA